MKLLQFITSQTTYSRRDIVPLITAGKVTLNGVVVDSLTATIDTQKDRVMVNGVPVMISSGFLYYKFHKPRNVITTLSDAAGRPDLSRYVRHMPPNLFPVGRLDRQTTGLLLLTTDGELANRILHPSHGLEKLYRVTVDHKIRDADCRRLLEGFFIEDGPVKFSEVERVSDVTVLVSIHEGRNRIVRRSFAALGYEVTGLQRLAVGPILLGKLESGKFQKMTPREVMVLKRAVLMAEPKA